MTAHVTCSLRPQGAHAFQPLQRGAQSHVLDGTGESAGGKQQLSQIPKHSVHPTSCVLAGLRAPAAGAIPSQSCAPMIPPYTLELLGGRSSCGGQPRSALKRGLPGARAHANFRHSDGQHTVTWGCSQSIRSLSDRVRPGRQRQGPL